MVFATLHKKLYKQKDLCTQTGRVELVRWVTSRVTTEDILVITAKDNRIFLRGVVPKVTNWGQNKSLLVKIVFYLVAWRIQPGTNNWQKLSRPSFPSNFPPIAEVSVFSLSVQKKNRSNDKPNITLDKINRHTGGVFIFTKKRRKSIVRKRLNPYQASTNETATPYYAALFISPRVAALWGSNCITLPWTCSNRFHERFDEIQTFLEPHHLYTAWSIKYKH